MSTWEERMSLRAKAREEAAQGREQAAKAERLAAIAIRLPARPGETRPDWFPVDDEHFGHLTHLCFNVVRCSCGGTHGVTCCAPPDEPPPPCEICLARRIGEFAPR